MKTIEKFANVMFLLPGALKLWELTRKMVGNDHKKLTPIYVRNITSKKYV